VVVVHEPLPQSETWVTGSDVTELGIGKNHFVGDGGLKQAIKGNMIA
jgi:hypothetical protein